MANRGSRDIYRRSESGLSLSHGQQRNALYVGGKGLTVANLAGWQILPVGECLDGSVALDF